LRWRKDGRFATRYGSGMDDARTAHAELAATPVAPFLSRHPGAASVFFAHRMACVGCSLSPFDTLADAAREYRLPLAEFLAELELASGTPAANDAGPRPIEPDRSPR